MTKPCELLQTLNFFLKKDARADVRHIPYLKIPPAFLQVTVFKQKNVFVDVFIDFLINFLKNITGPYIA